MIIVDTPFHITFSSHNHKPCSACVGLCKKIWWDFDLVDYVNKAECEQCGHDLVSSIEGVHYKVIKQSNRNFRPKDFKGFRDINKQELAELSQLVTIGTIIDHLSKVKSAFVEKAKADWCK
jgi:predicted RNA-binding protein